MHSYLSDSSYNLFSNICKIFGTSEKFLIFLGFTVFLSQTRISIGICLCAHDLKAGDWSPSKWQRFSLSAPAKGIRYVLILSNKAIKRTGCSFWKYILMEIAGRWLRKELLLSTSVKRPSPEWSQTKEHKTVREMETTISMWIL